MLFARWAGSCLCAAGVSTVVLAPAARRSVIGGRARSFGHCAARHTRVTKLRARHVIARRSSLSLRGVRARGAGMCARARRVCARDPSCYCLNLEKMRAALLPGGCVVCPLCGGPTSTLQYSMTLADRRGVTPVVENNSRYGYAISMQRKCAASDVCGQVRKNWEWSLWQE